MTDDDTRIETVTERLQDELVDEAGQPADPAEVQEVVASKAEAFADAPVQDFVPLLVEHEARDELREHGLHRELAETPDDAPLPPAEADVMDRAVDGVPDAWR